MVSAVDERKAGRHGFPPRARQHPDARAGTTGWPRRCTAAATVRSRSTCRSTVPSGRPRSMPRWPGRRRPGSRSRCWWCTRRPGWWRRRSRPRWAPGTSPGSARVVPDPGRSVLDELAADPGMFGAEWHSWTGDLVGAPAETAYFLFHDCDLETLRWALSTRATVAGAEPLRGPGGADAGPAALHVRAAGGRPDADAGLDAPGGPAAAEDRPGGGARRPLSARIPAGARSRRCWTAEADCMSWWNSRTSASRTSGRRRAGWRGWRTGLRSSPRARSTRWSARACWPRRSASSGSARSSSAGRTTRSRRLIRPCGPAAC